MYWVPSEPGEDPRTAKDAINDLRRVMGTLPEQAPKLETKFLRGVEGIEVELIDYPTNPYKSLYVLATSCWGGKINKWDDTSPENRFLVVKAVLERQALPLALEAATFVFSVEGPSRAAFDQLARTRIGAVFSAKGMRDNNWKGCDIRIPNALWPTNQEWSLADYIANHPDQAPTEDEVAAINKVIDFNDIQATMKKVKQTYANIVDNGKASWQAARTVLPLYVVYGYSAAYNLMSLMGVCANRLRFCEMEDTVAVAWLMAKEVEHEFPLIGSYLRPSCDFTHKCQYHKSYTLSEMFGCLFKECGRNPCPDSREYAEFNEICTDVKILEKQLGIKIPGPNEWPVYDTFESLCEADKMLLRS